MSSITNSTTKRKEPLEPRTNGQPSDKVSEMAKRRIPTPPPPNSPSLTQASKDNGRSKFAKSIDPINQTTTTSVKRLTESLVEAVESPDADTTLPAKEELEPKKAHKNPSTEAIPDEVLFSEQGYLFADLMEPQSPLPSLTPPHLSRLHYPANPTTVDMRTMEAMAKKSKGANPPGLNKQKPASHSRTKFEPLGAILRPAEHYTVQGDAFQKSGNHFSALINYEIAKKYEDDFGKKTELQNKIAESKSALEKAESLEQQRVKQPGAEKLAKRSLKKGISHLNSHQLQEAIGCFEKGAEVANSANIPQLRMQLLLQLGSAYYQQGNFPNCIAAWQQGIPLINDNLQLKTQMIELLAKAYVQGNMSDEAMKTEFSSAEKGKLIIYLADILLEKQDHLSACKLLLLALDEHSTFSDESNLRFCNKLIRISRETNDFMLYHKIKDLGISFTNTAAETKTNFLFESAQAEEAQGNDSKAIELYQFLLDNASIDIITAQALVLKIAYLQGKDRQ